MVKLTQNSVYVAFSVTKEFEGIGGLMLLLADAGPNLFTPFDK